MRMRTTAGGIALAAVLVIVADQSRTPAAIGPADGQLAASGSHFALAAPTDFRSRS